METIAVAILDDHPSLIDGYIFRLSKTPGIQVVATASYGDELEPLLQKHKVDVLLLDVNVPNSSTDPNPFPILYAIPRVLETHPELAILVISMYDQRSLIKALMEAGASGYIVKDDKESAERLGDIALSVAKGEIYYSPETLKLISGEISDDVPFLTRRQKELLSLCAANPYLTTREIANVLNVAPSTVRNLLSNTYVRLGVRNRTGALAKAKEWGLITPDAPLPPT